LAKEPKAGQLTDEAGKVLLDAGDNAPAGAAEEGENIGGDWDNDGEHTMAVDRMSALGDLLELDSRQLVFDTRDFLLDVIKSRPKPWSGTTQQEQRDVIAAAEHCAELLVRKVVEAVASRGTESIRVLLTKINAGTDIVITGKVKFADDDPKERDRAIMTLHHAINKHVMVTRASVEDYRQDGEDREIDGDPDEPGLSFEADDGGDEEDEQE
jgi:hypothetical protein